MNFSCSFVVSSPCEIAARLGFSVNGNSAANRRPQLIRFRAVPPRLDTLVQARHASGQHPYSKRADIIAKSCTLSHSYSRSHRLLSTYWANNSRQRPTNRKFCRANHPRHNYLTLGKVKSPAAKKPNGMMYLTIPQDRV